jgi:hypothetical protein
MLSVLRLNEVRLEKLVIRANPNPAMASAGEPYRISLTHSPVAMQTGGADAWHQLRVRLIPTPGEPAGHSFSEIDVVVDGRFRFAEGTSGETQRLLYPVAAVSILYGLARGLVAQATGACPAGAFLLPPLDVSASAKRKTLVGECVLVSGPAGAPHFRPTAEVLAGLNDAP